MAKGDLSRAEKKFADKALVTGWRIPEVAIVIWVARKDNTEPNFDTLEGIRQDVSDHYVS